MSKTKSNETVSGIQETDDVVQRKMAPELNGMKYCIVRTYSAGVFAGYVKSHKDKEVEMIEARRIWYWAGAASLSQLAMSGTSKPHECKFPEAVSSIILTEAIEIIECTEAAKNSIDGVPIWKA